MDLLTGKNTLITGAGGGIGQIMAVKFAREGARVALCGRSTASLEKTRGLVVAAGGEALVVPADISVSDQCRDMIAEIVKTFGSLDAAVNNAGVDGVQAPLADYSEESFDEVMAINLKGNWNCMRFEIAQMVQQGGGAIVNISSTTTCPTMSHMSAYVGSKYGLHGLSKTAAYEYAPKNIRINVLLPGAIETPMLTEYLASSEGLLKPLLQGIPMGRLGRGEEVSNAAAWLCSDAASYVTGAELTCDGGHALRGGRSGWES